MGDVVVVVGAAPVLLNDTSTQRGSCSRNPEHGNLDMSLEGTLLTYTRDGALPEW